MKYLRKKLNTYVGWVRLNIFAVCPLCNHDAPLLYECQVCVYYKKLPRYRDEQTEEQRKEVWDKFKEIIGDI